MIDDKRFTFVRKKNPILNEMENYIEDNSHTILKITVYSDCEDIVDVLNALNDENEQLKRQIGNLEHTRDFVGDVCADCNRLENEVDELKSSLDFCRINVKRLNDNKKELNDENKQLKSKYSEQCIQLDFLKAENEHMKEVLDENKRLKSELNLYKNIGIEELKIQLNDSECATKIKSLEYENKRLKKEQDRLVSETAETIAKHRKKVLDLIDVKIRKADTYRTPLIDDDLGYWNGVYQKLKELKKELQEF